MWVVIILILSGVIVVLVRANRRYRSVLSNLTFESEIKTARLALLRKALCETRDHVEWVDHRLADAEVIEHQLRRRIGSLIRSGHRLAERAELAESMLTMTLEYTLELEDFHTCTNPECPQAGECRGQCVHNFIPLDRIKLE